MLKVNVEGPISYDDAVDALVEITDRIRYRDDTCGNIFSSKTGEKIGEWEWTRPIKTVSITLEIEYDPNNFDSPEDWDWASLTDVPEITVTNFRECD